MIVRVQFMDLRTMEVVCDRVTEGRNAIRLERKKYGALAGLKETYDWVHVGSVPYVAMRSWVEVEV